jgi:hypothetical protein
MIHYNKGDPIFVEGLQVMDDGEYDEKDLVRVSNSNNPYICVTQIQANYCKYGEWIKIA